MGDHSDMNYDRPRPIHTTDRLEAETRRLKAEMAKLQADKELFEKRWCDTTEDCAVLRAEVERLKDEGKRDYDGMRSMQAKFMEADHKWRDMAVEIERLKNNEIAEGDGIAFLREELRQANLQNGGMRELLSQFRDNLHLHEHLSTVPVEECPQAPCQKVMKYMEKQRNEPLTVDQENALDKAGNSMFGHLWQLEKPINEHCWCSAKAEAKDAVCPIHDTVKPVDKPEYRCESTHDGMRCQKTPFRHDMHVGWLEGGVKVRWSEKPR